MFVQVVRGVVVDADSAFARLDDWFERLSPAAPGWLGTTAGVTRDDELVAFVRFASATDARRSSDRIEQGLWWAESAVVFTGDVVFDNYEEVTLFGEGGSDGAGVVEVLLARVHRSRTSGDLVEQLVQHGRERGPGVIGGLVGLHDDGHLTQAVYFGPPEPGSSGTSLDPATLLGGPHVVPELRLLRLERLWLASPGAPPRRRPERM